MDKHSDMLPECKVLFDNTKESLKRIENTNKEEFKEIKNILNDHGDDLSNVREDVAYIKGKMKGNNPGNPGANNPGNNPGNSINVNSSGSFIIKWNNLSGLTRSIVKILSAIGSILLILGGSKITGII